MAVISLGHYRRDFGEAEDKPEGKLEGTEAVSKG